MTYTYQKNSNGLYICLSCKYTSQNQNTMHYHYKTHDEKDHKCSKCEKEFISKQALEKHMIAKHETSKQLYSCKSCTFQSSSKGNCQIHHVRMHCKKEILKILEESDSGLNCKSCNKTFNGPTSYYYHAFDCLKIEESKAYVLSSNLKSQSPSCQ